MKTGWPNASSQCGQISNEVVFAYSSEFSYCSEENSCFHFCGIKNRTVFFLPINSLRSFFGFQCKDRCYLSKIVWANVMIINIEFQQTFVEIQP